LVSKAITVMEHAGLQTYKTDEETSAKKLIVYILSSTDVIGDDTKLTKPCSMHLSSGINTGHEINKMSHLFLHGERSQSTGYTRERYRERQSISASHQKHQIEIKGDRSGIKGTEH
jgi:hypothetical protein